MPEWADVDLFQTVLLVVATGVAYFTYQGEKDARRDAAIERRFGHVAERIAELGEALIIDANEGGARNGVYVAQRHLRSALVVIDKAVASLPTTHRLLTSDLGAIRSPEIIDEALAEVAATLTAMTD